MKDAASRPIVFILLEREQGLHLSCSDVQQVPALRRREQQAITRIAPPIDREADLGGIAGDLTEALGHVDGFIHLQISNEDRPFLSIGVGRPIIVPSNIDSFLGRLDEHDRLTAVEIKCVQPVVRAIPASVRGLSPHGSRVSHLRPVEREADALRGHVLQQLSHRAVFKRYKGGNLFVRDVANVVPRQEIVAGILHDDGCAGEAIEGVLRSFRPSGGPESDEYRIPIGRPGDGGRRRYR